MALTVVHLAKPNLHHVGSAPIPSPIDQRHCHDGHRARPNHLNRTARRGVLRGPVQLNAAERLSLRDPENQDAQVPSGRPLAGAPRSAQDDSSSTLRTCPKPAVEGVRGDGQERATHCRDPSSRLPSLRGSPGGPRRGASRCPPYRSKPGRGSPERGETIHER
jgi:hypothetical protein